MSDEGQKNSGGGSRRRRRRRSGGSNNSGGGSNNSGGGRNNSRGGRKNSGGGRKNSGGGRKNSRGGRKNSGGGRKNSRGGRKNSRRNSRGGRKNSRGDNRGNRNNSGGGRKSRTPAEKFGGREPVSGDTTPRRDGPIVLNAFELFCAWHLGITEDNQYRKPSMRELTRRFDTSQQEIEEGLRLCGMDNASLADADFDFELARLDVRVAPDGIDKRELAKPLFEEFAVANPHFVNWSADDADDEGEADDDAEAAG